MNLEAKNIVCKVGNSFLLDGFSYLFTEKYLFGIITSRKEKSDIILKSLCGLYDLVSGEVSYGNEIVNPIHVFNSQSVRKKISFVFRSGGLLSNLSVLENLFLPLDFHYPEKTQEEKISKIMEYIDKFEILNSILQKRPAQLSVHENKLVLIIRGYITEPKIILYDEPTDGLDIRSRRLVIKEILKKRREKDCLQIFSTHFENEIIKYSDSLLIIDEGKLVEAGNLMQLATSENSNTKSLLEDYLKSSTYETEI
jgi:ABC-type multidrug transport system ATPase subunit